MSAGAAQPQAAAGDLTGVIQAEFNEMPCMRLTFAEVRRFWNLSAEDCQRVLDALVRAGVLIQDAQQRYRRPD